MRMRWVVRSLLVPVVVLLTAAAPPSEPPGQAKRSADSTTTTTTTTTAPAPVAAAAVEDGPPAHAAAPAQQAQQARQARQVKQAKDVRAAAVALTIETITWDVIGLDSTDVNDGPNVYPVGVRVCAGGGDVHGITLGFTWDTANPYIQLLSASTQSIDVLADGACVDRYFFVVVTRDPAAYDTARGYHVTANAPGVTAVSTPTPRQLYVERLLSQNRNAVLSISGPTTVYQGDTVTYTVEASTAPNGYSQLDTFLNLLSPIFSLLGVEVDYETPPGATTSSPYADACGWDPDPTSPTYRSCLGTGKVGGTITGTYTGLVTGTGTASLTTAIIDVSGASYHYNADYGTAPNLLMVVALPSADLAVEKTPVGDFVAGGTGGYVLTVTNQGPSDSPGPVTLTDTLPEGMTFVSAEGAGWECSAAGRTVTCTHAAPLGLGRSSAVTLRVALDPALTGRTVNAVTVRGPARDLDPLDNADSAAVDVEVPRATDTARASRDAARTAGEPDAGGLPATGGSTLALTALAVVLLAAGVGLRRAASR
ncbi:MAG TPA: DUF11 domain-containing protein [Acidimicrobiales bacterium]|nr:DUF11 domain-containing protein [Acidimicrobiales bacterium]